MISNVENIKKIDFEGKTIKEMEIDNFNVSIRFTDGSVLDVGSDNAWDPLTINYLEDI